MVDTVIAITLAAVLYSLWVRRHTWTSRWEIGASLNVALQGCSVLLMSPWASAELSAPLHRVVRRWNVEDVLGHLCLVAAVAAVIHHALARLRDRGQASNLFCRHVVLPVSLGVPVLVAVFVIADEGYHPDLFPVPLTNLWLGVYWLVLGGLLIYLLSYAGRVLLVLRTDPRSRATVDLYLIATGCGVAAGVIQVGTAWAGIDVTLPVWVCGCLGATIFAYAAARSWRVRVGWFSPESEPPSQSIPPHPTS